MARPANPDLREKILKAASEIIEGCGPDCVTMREVAEKVGYTPTTLYLYFKDKNAILRESVLRGFDGLADACNAAMVGPTGLDKFRQRCRAYVVWGLTNPGTYRLMFESPGDVTFEGTDLARATRGLTDGAGPVREAVLAGEMREPDDGRLFAAAAWSAIHGVTSLAISRRLLTGDKGATPKGVLEMATGTADVLVGCLIESLRT